VSSSPRVLIVDDDQGVLDVMHRTLRGEFDTVTAASVTEAIGVLRRSDDVAVVVSDLRMPGTDGIAFLSLVRKLAPDVVRILLTGYGDVEAATKAVNEGQVFRFLRKPCPPATVVAAVRAAAEQHSLIVSEHVLLEGTLHGCVDALTDVLAITSPLSFARAVRVKECVGGFAVRFGVPYPWQLEVAATLSQIGAASLPASVAEKVYFGRALDADEEALVARLPGYAAGVVAHIPRLEAVREILAHVVPSALTDPNGALADDAVPLGARLLRIAFDFDVLITQGHGTHAAIAELTARTGAYDPYLLHDFSVFQGELYVARRTRRILVTEVAVGMTLATDVLDEHGVLLVAHGHEVSPRALDLIRSYFEHDATTRTVLILLDNVDDQEPLPSALPDAA
jgi:response regulator RpfG family c-di-GMP phosphodiesterase